MADAYYNEIDAYAAQWLRNLIAKGLIAKGDVDERSIRDVAPDDLLPLQTLRLGLRADTALSNLAEQVAFGRQT